MARNLADFELSGPSYMILRNTTLKVSHMVPFSVNAETISYLIAGEAAAACLGSGIQIWRL
ncbi:hypothetical protein IFM47457_08228 [Aspergillus lentulus]|nr:hypothetical protein IFM47457_08228 [Aspergillus lentulus]